MEINHKDDDENLVTYYLIKYCVYSTAQFKYYTHVPVHACVFTCTVCKTWTHCQLAICIYNTFRVSALNCHFGIYTRNTDDNQ